MQATITLALPSSVGHPRGVSQSGAARLERFHCEQCGTPLTRPVLRLPGVPQPRPEVTYEDVTEATLPEGTWAFDAEPPAWAPRDKARFDPEKPPGLLTDRPVGVWNCPVLNKVDLLDLPSHPDSWRSSGCCGRAGGDGPNVVCPSCGELVATIMDDCHTRQEVRLEPERVIACPVGV